MSDDDRKTQRFLKSPPRSAPGQTYKLVEYLTAGTPMPERAIEPPGSSGDHRLLVVCQAPSVAALLSRFGRIMAERFGDGVKKAAQAIVSGGSWPTSRWSTNPEVPELLAFLRTIDDPGRRVAAYFLLDAPFYFARTMDGCETYFGYLPATFPDHELVVAWEAAPPLQEAGFAIVQKRAAKRVRVRKKKAKAGAKRSSSPRRASRRKPRRRS